MGLFKGLGDKQYTKADYYREMEERHAAKLAAKVAPVVVVPIQEPEWLAAENVTTELVSSIKEEIVVPFVEPSIQASVTETQSDIQLNTRLSIQDLNESQETSTSLKEEENKPATVKVPKQRRKKIG